MTDCKGLFGKLFGHCFKKHLIRFGDEPRKRNAYDDSTIKMIGEYAFIHIKQLNGCYEIRCKRCGINANEK
jgi:hypothetical protein